MDRMGYVQTKTPLYRHNRAILAAMFEQTERDTREACAKMFDDLWQAGDDDASFAAELIRKGAK